MQNGGKIWDINLHAIFLSEEYKNFRCTCIIAYKIYKLACLHTEQY